MAYRLTYDVTIQWVGPGQGPMGGGLAVIRGSEFGGAQVLGLYNIAGGQNITGTGTGGALASADVDVLTGTSNTTGMCGDINAQLKSAAVAAITGGWPQGNP